jgi:glycosyltransferase involved in cell wall biosynthesis
VPGVKILFISRNYPPQIGGLESYSYNLIKCIGEHHAVSKVVLGKPRKHLFWFMPYALLKAVQLIKKDRVLRIHLCDGFLSIIGVLFKCLLPVTVSVTIHGLDITFRNWLYQSIVPRCVARLDKIICVSRHTQKECIERGIPAYKTNVIPNGIDPADFKISRSRQRCRAEWMERLGIPLEGKRILLTVGRLVPRKGVAWFVKEVVPRLNNSYLYLIVGEGPDFVRVSALVDRLNLGGRVFLLGRVTGEMRNRLLHASDVFIMPNVQVDGDVEGFGIAAIEAGCCGLPVIASDLQGLKDAVLHGRTGFLVEARNTEAFLESIQKIDLDRDAVRSWVVETFEWQRVSQRYEEVLGLFPSLEIVRQ